MKPNFCFFNVAIRTGPVHQAVHTGVFLELGFLTLKISLFGCYVARAFSRACSIDLIFVYVWA